MIIILVSSFKEHPKVPAIEQKLSTATAAQNISLHQCNEIFMYMENRKISF